MINGKTVYALIPARGGSKRLPKKNILPLCGKPLIIYSIECALRSPYIDCVIVSTDCEDIAKIAKDNKADVPFLRPAALSTSDATSEDVVKHALSFLKSENAYPDILIVLQPTSPLRTTEDVNRSIELFIEKNASCIKSVYKSNKSPLWYKNLDEEGKLYDYISEMPEYKSLRDITNVFLLNGAIYIFNSDDFLFNKDKLDHNSYAYVMTQDKSVDIDNEIDFIMAELLLKRVKN